MNESILFGNPRAQQHNQQIRDEATTIPALRPQDVFSQAKSSDNYALLGEGAHGNLVLDTPDVHLVGLSGAEVGTLSIRADCRVTGLLVRGTVIVYPGNTAIFTDCTFEAPVVYQTTADGHLIGCLFRRLSQVTKVAPGSAFIIGCSRKSGLAHFGVTVLAETT